MSTPIKHNHFPKLLFGITFLFVVCIFACNGSGSSTEAKDSTMTKDSSAMMKDTSGSKMKMDSAKTDTSGKGGQPVPPQK